MVRAPRLSALLCTLPLLMAPRGGRAEVDSDQARRQQVVVRGDGVAITVGQIEDMVARQPPAARSRYRDGDDLEKLVQSMVRAELLANEAARRGYANDPQVRYLAKDSAAQALVRAEIDDKVAPETIPAADVAAYYAEHPAEFHRVPMRRASQIVFDSEAEALRILPEAQKADARMFAELAKSNSKEPETKMQGGDLGYFAKKADDDPARDKTQPVVQPAVRAAVFALAEVGDVSKQPLVLGAQRVIVRFSAERPERHVSLEDAALSIRAKLWRERRQQALERLQSKLRSKEQPKIFSDRIYKISFDDMEKRPSGFVPDPIPSAPTAQPGKGKP